MRHLNFTKWAPPKHCGDDWKKCIIDITKPFDPVDYIFKISGVPRLLQRGNITVLKGEAGCGKSAFADIRGIPRTAGSCGGSRCRRPLQKRYRHGTADTFRAHRPPNTGGGHRSGNDISLHRHLCRHVERTGSQKNAPQHLHYDNSRDGHRRCTESRSPTFLASLILTSLTCTRKALPKQRLSYLFFLLTTYLFSLH